MNSVYVASYGLYTFYASRMLKSVQTFCTPIGTCVFVLHVNLTSPWILILRVHVRGFGEKLETVTRRSKPTIERRCQIWCTSTGGVYCCDRHRRFIHITRGSSACEIKCMMIAYGHTFPTGRVHCFDAGFPLITGKLPTHTSNRVLVYPIM